MRASVPEELNSSIITTCTTNVPPAARLFSPQISSTQTQSECTRNKPVPYTGNRPRTTTAALAHSSLVPAIRTPDATPHRETLPATSNSPVSRESRLAPALSPDSDVPPSRCDVVVHAAPQSYSPQKSRCSRQ